MEFSQSLSRTVIVPVMVIRDVAHAVPLARALVAGGLDILEITLRTSSALEAMRRISAEVEGAIVGAGTVIHREQLADSARAGAKFIVCPGLVEDLALAARDQAMPLLPGVATPSDIMRGLGCGLSLFKFFPAESLGGVSSLKALSGPFPQVRFCPTGGVTPKNLPDYLALPNVIAAGGSWMIPADLAEAGAFDRVTIMARHASDMAKARRAA
jgi:2-dehydro-3-deoxyphosphogluconate aldolase / (4S)-4-hydroxy-2-oxoglutarate aldolase